MAETSRFRALAYAVRGRVMARYLGQLCLIQAVLMLPPVFVGAVTGSYAFVLRSVLTVVVLTMAGWLLMRIPAPRELQRNEAITLSALAFLLSPLVMTWPMTAFGLAPVDALFETVSGVTTTGLTTLAVVADRPAAFYFLRAWMQWYGGLGIVVLSLAILTRHQVTMRRLAAGEIRDEDIIGGIRAHARGVLLIYLALTAAGMALILLSGTGTWTALLHTFTAVSTGGFSSLQMSLCGLNTWLQRMVVIGVSFSGAICLTLYYYLAHGRWRKWLGDHESHMLLVLSVVSSAALVAALLASGGHRWQEAVGHGVLTGFSAQTTTGFSSLPMVSLPSVAKLVVIVSMFIGASLGSTGGGVKILRAVILFRLLQSLLRRTLTPRHAVIHTRVQGSRLESRTAVDAMLVIALFVVCNAVGWGAMLAYGQPPLDSLFDVVSATGTVGLSTGVVSPDLPAVLKVMLCVNMLAGRLEVLALLVLVYPRTWVGRRREMQ
ncbi:MAG: TrkH family potassium uptake protein [Phycisphaerae bacterium]